MRSASAMRRSSSSSLVAARDRQRWPAGRCGREPAQQAAGLGNGEAGALRELDEREPVEDVGVIEAAPAAAPWLGEQPLGLVITNGGGRDAGPFGDFPDGECRHDLRPAIDGSDPPPPLREPRPEKLDDREGPGSDHHRAGRRSETGASERRDKDRAAGLQPMEQCRTRNGQGTEKLDIMVGMVGRGR